MPTATRGKIASATRRNSNPSTARYTSPARGINVSWSARRSFTTSTRKTGSPLKCTQVAVGSSSRSDLAAPDGVHRLAHPVNIACIGFEKHGDRRHTAVGAQHSAADERLTFEQGPCLARRLFVNAFFLNQGPQFQFREVQAQEPESSPAISTARTRWIFSKSRAMLRCHVRACASNTSSSPIASKTTSTTASSYPNVRLKSSENPTSASSPR